MNAYWKDRIWMMSFTLGVATIIYGIAIGDGTWLVIGAMMTISGLLVTQ